MKISNHGVLKPACLNTNPDQLISLFGFTCCLLVGLNPLGRVAQATTNTPAATAIAQTEPVSLQPEPAPAMAEPAAALPASPAENMVPPPSETTPAAEQPISPAAAFGLLATPEELASKPPIKAVVPPSAATALPFTAVAPAAGAAASDPQADDFGNPMATIAEPAQVEVAPAIAAAHSPLPDDTAIAAAGASSGAAIGQVPESTPAVENPAVEGNEALTEEAAEPIEAYRPLLQFQAASIYQDDELSGRLRASALYALNEQVMFGATVDLVGGNAFVDSEDEGLSLNELYVSAAPFQNLPNLRFVGGLIDLTSYFDRNSFAKDVVTHFFNPVFQTNPALSSAGIGSRPGVLVNWSATDQLEFKAVAFSSSRDLGDLSLDGFAAEAGFRTGNFILRGTVSTARDAGDDTGFDELFQIQRDDGSFGLADDDREVAYGINAEYFIDAINLGLFGRYGWYENQDADSSGDTFSVGVNALDLFMAGDRLGLGYGRELSNGDLRSGKTPDVWEVFYDAPIYRQVRAGISLQSREEFSDTFFGIRVRADW